MTIATTKTHTEGFTLIELLIVVAIIGVLASIAIPAYQTGVLTAGRGEGQSVLLQVASDQERFYNNNNSYSTNALPLVSPAVATRNSDSNLYTVTVAACGTGTIANCFIATATPINSQTADICGNLTLTNTGVKAASGGTVDDCWN